MTNNHTRMRTMLLAATALAGGLSLAMASPAAAQERSYALDLPAQPLSQALMAFGSSTDQQIVFSEAIVKGRAAPKLKGDYTASEALAMLLDDTGLVAQRNADGVVLITRASDPQSGSAAGDGADSGTVQALIVTAQKREEAIQDVPIAISAFTEKALEEQKIEGGFDLLKAIPNVTFSKNNFTSYNFSIRGIGTKAVSATTDPGVAVSFNNAGLIQNRLFEQEYFDVERVEVLRGPQGTLYGRNATAGVINVISAKPDMDEFKGSIKGEVGNYHSKRIVGMVNVPLIEDKLAVRFAGSLTNRSGYDFNDTTDHAVNGRDLWSARVSVGFNPTERLRTSLVWERFNEDDNRSRTGKQLCKRDPGPTKIGDAQIGFGPISQAYYSGQVFSQGCLPVSLYDDQAFQTPNGWSLPFVGAIMFLQGGCLHGEYLGLSDAFMPIAERAGTRDAIGLLNCNDPYGGLSQSRDLRVINSFRDPIYRAKADVIQFSLEYELTEALQLAAQTTYDKDSVYSFQDYNRFNTVPVFNDSSNFYENGVGLSPSRWRELARGGVYCDPQVGCSKTIAGFDISKAKSSQFIQEVRLQSDFDGALNFSAGVNYTRFKVLADYYVFFNLISALTQMPPFNQQGDPTLCNVPVPPPLFSPFLDPALPNGAPGTGCPYIDPNPVESINGEGHNYYRNKNPYKLNSAAAFGEVYWNATETLKLTAGLRYTDDRKTFIPVPSQLLLAPGLFNAGAVNRGYPEKPAIKQHWGEVTGRLGIDWKPDLTFTDQTMVYAFYSRGYKGGGSNPPGIGYETRTNGEIYFETPVTCADFGAPAGCIIDHPPIDPIAQNSGPTFKPEFVNALEIGAKNTLLGGALTFNTDAFFYDYKDYQVSKVVDRTVSNENFDATVWGLEFETQFTPSRNFQIVGNLGYLNTAIGEGAESIDVMNRTQGHDDWVLVRPWIQLPSNCIVPKALAEQQLNYPGGIQGLPNNYPVWCGGNYIPILTSFGVNAPLDPATGLPYDPHYYDGTNGRPNIHGGAGFAQNLEGNELPNSPHWTANVGAQYGFEFADGWKATIRGDAYWQSQSWARVYNAVNDKLHGWYNANLSLWVENDDGLKIELYAKNLLDKTPITDAFINSDDTALTTNVFVLDPRLIGLSIKKDF